MPSKKANRGHRTDDTSKRKHLPACRTKPTKPVEISIEGFEAGLLACGVAQLRDELRHGIFSGSTANYVERLVRDTEAEQAEYCAATASRSMRRTEAISWATLVTAILTLLAAL